MQNSQTIAMVQKVIAGFVALILGRNVPVYWGNTAHMRSDGSIMLPRPQVGDATEVAMLTRLAVHEAGHAEHTDTGCFDRLDPDTLGVFNLLEDPRMEMRQVQNYPGANLILSRSLDDLMVRAMNNVGVETEEQRARLLQMDILVRGMLATTPRETFRAHGEKLRELSGQILSEAQSVAIDACVNRIPMLANSQECEALAAELIAKLRQAPPPEEAQDQTGAGADSSQHDPSDKSPADGGADDEQASAESNDPSVPQDGQPSSSCSQDGDAEEKDVGGQTESTPNSDSSGSDAEENPDAASERDKASASADQAAGQQEPTKPSSEQDGDDVQASKSAGADDAHEAGTSPDNEQQGSDSGGGTDDATSGDQGSPGSETGTDTATGGTSQKPGGANDGTEAQASGGTPSGQCGIPELSTSMDLGELLRAALRETYGESPDEGEGSTETTQASPEIIKAIEQLLQGDAQDLETMLAEAEQLVEAAMAAEIKGEASEQAHQEHSLNDQDVEARLPRNAPFSETGLDLRLQGVESRLVHVLLRELQDRRKRPTRHARAGAHVASQRYWRLQQLGDTKVFKARNNVTGIDAAVTILLDRSGSMEEILETAARTALAFSFALQRVGNVRASVAMFPAIGSFTEDLQGFGRSPREAAQRCESLVALGSTPVAQAILEEMPKLLAQRKKRNMMVVITDDGPDSVQLLGAAMAEADRQGVEVVGIGIGCDVSSYYPLSTSIHQVEELPGALEVLFRSHVAQRLAA